jgi:hypothetical protein
MSADEPEAERGGTSDASQRARLAIVLGATFVLAAIVGIVVATGGSDESPATPTGTCFVAWNNDPLAPRQDGIHAYTAHGYRQTLVARIDRDGNIVEDADDGLEPDDTDAPCAVIFASPQVDQEPNFGVRVLDDGRWTGLDLAGGTQLEDIARLQAEAVAESNAVLSANGLLAEE